MIGRSGSDGQPAQVYLAFKKKDSTGSIKQLQVNAQAQYDEEKKRFVGAVDFSKQFDLVNGLYSVQLVAQDTSAEETQTWELGQLELWFKEGQSEANN